MTNGGTYSLGKNDAPDCQEGYHRSADGSGYELCPATSAKLTFQGDGTRWMKFSDGGTL